MESTRFPLAVEIPEQQLRIAKLARDLAHSEHDAEDLAQEAWLAALRRKGHGIDHLGGWMRTVTVRLAGKLGTRGRRRREWELRAARSEAETSFLEGLERRSLREYLERQIDALPEPYREVLRLRYLDEQTPEAIARRLQRSGGTVRSQINRGLAQLRLRINGELDAERGLRGTVVLAWLARRSTQALLAASAAVVVGLVLLRPATDRPVAARAGGLVAADGARDATRTRAGADDRDTPGSTATLPRQSAALLASSTGSPTLAVDVSGRVLDHVGAPVPDAEVWVSPPGSDDPVLAAHADASGAYRLAGLAPESWVGARFEGRYPSPRLFVDSFANEGAAEVDLVIPRQLPGKLVVQVCDADGAPLPGASIRVVPGFSSEPFRGPNLELRRLPSGYAGQADALGLFEAWKLGGRVSYVQVVAAGHAPAFVKTRRSFLLPERVVVTLARPVGLAGGLRLPDGTPARGAHLFLEQEHDLPPLEAFAGPDGSFAFDGLAPGCFRLRAIGGGLASLVHEGELPAGAQPQVLELSLSSDWTVAGLAVDPEGAPVSGAKVTLADRATVTDHHGRFAFGALGALGALDGALDEAQAVVRVYRAGSAVPVAWLGDCQPGDTSLRLVTVEPGASVAGRLVGAGADTRLSLRAPFLEQELALPREPGEPDAFRSGPLQPGVYELVARSHGSAACVVRRFALPFGEALDLGELALPAPGALMLRLSGVRPLGDKLPQLTLASDLFTLRCITSFAPDGRGGGVLRVERIPPGTYDAFLTTPGFADVLETIEIEDGQELVRELTLVEGLRRDFVLDVPIAGRTPGKLPALRLTGPAGSRRVFSAAQPSPDDREGPYLSLNLAPGTYLLAAEEGELRGEVAFTVEGPLARPAANPLRIELHEELRSP